MTATDRLLALLALLAALLAAGAGLAALQGWRQVIVVILVVVAGGLVAAAGLAATLGAVATPPRRLLYGGVSLGTAALTLALVLVGTRSSGAPSEPTATPPGQDASIPPPAPTGQDRGTGESMSCQTQDGVDVPCTAADAALAVTRIAGCSREGVATTWGLDHDLDNLLIDTAAGADGITCLVSPDAAARAAGATALDLQRAANGTVTPALRACADRNGEFSVACSQRHELEFVGPWRAESGDDVTQLCRAAAVRYTETNLSGPGLLLRDVALRGQASTGEQTFRCAVAADRALVGSVRSLGSAEPPVAGD